MKKTYNTPSTEVVRSEVQALLITVSDGNADSNLPVLSKKNDFLIIDDDVDNE